MKKQNCVITKSNFFSTYKSKTFASKTFEKYQEHFPIFASPELAYIVASINTDGFMDIRKRNKSLYFGYMGFFSKNNDELKGFNKIVMSIFGISGKIRKWGVRKSGFSKGCIIINSFLIRVLFIAGCIGGDKVSQKYFIPCWVKNGSKEIQANFLKASFSCEGSISFSKNKKCWEIKYSMFKEEGLESNLMLYLEDLINMLSNFGIKTSGVQRRGNHVRTKDSKKILGKSIRITNKQSIVNFHKFIGFYCIFKQKRLETAVKDNIYK